MVRERGMGVTEGEKNGRRSKEEEGSFLRTLTASSPPFFSGDCIAAKRHLRLAAFPRFPCMIDYLQGVAVCPLGMSIFYFVR